MLVTHPEYGVSGVIILDTRRVCDLPLLSVFNITAVERKMKIKLSKSSDHSFACLISPGMYLCSVTPDVATDRRRKGLCSIKDES